MRTYRGGTELDADTVRLLRDRGILFENDRRVVALERGERTLDWRLIHEGATPAKRHMQGFRVESGPSLAALVHVFGPPPTTWGEVERNPDVPYRRMVPLNVNPFEEALRRLDDSLEV